MNAVIASDIIPRDEILPEETYIDLHINGASFAPRGYLGSGVPRYIARNLGTSWGGSVENELLRHPDIAEISHGGVPTTVRLWHPSLARYGYNRKGPRYLYASLEIMQIFVGESVDAEQSIS